MKNICLNTVIWFQVALTNTNNYLQFINSHPSDYRAGSPLLNFNESVGTKICKALLWPTSFRRQTVITATKWSPIYVRADSSPLNISDQVATSAFTVTNANLGDENICLLGNIVRYQC